jgi:hypothetical protein
MEWIFVDLCGMNGLCNGWNRGGCGSVAKLASLGLWEKLNLYLCNIGFLHLGYSCSASGLIVSYLSYICSLFCVSSSMYFM